MQVVLNIDSSNLGSTIEKVFESLTDEERKDLAKQVFLTLMLQNHTSERKAFIEAVKRKVWENCSYKQRDYKSPELIRDDDYDVKEKIKNFVSTQEKIWKSISEAASQALNESIKEIVTQDPQLQQGFTLIKEQMIKSFPDLIQNAICQYYASQMQDIGKAISQASMASCQSANVFNNVQQALFNKGIQI